MIHKVNIALHVVTGTIGLLVGTVTLLLYRRSKEHKRWGRYFLYLLSVVVVTGFAGWLFFRSNSFLLMLTLVSGYVGYAGYRTIQLREKKGTWIDALIAVAALGTATGYVASLQHGQEWSPAVIYSTLAALLLVTSYDLLKFFWLHNRIKSWWRYEHIYKMISAFSALLSAFTGTILPNLKPFSQIGPSIFCTALIIFFIIQQSRLNTRARQEG